MMPLTEEDIMYDQSIIKAEFNVTDNDFQDKRCLMVVPSPTKGLWLQNIVYSLRYHVVPALAAFLANSIYRSLAPLQRIPLSLPGVVRIRLKRTTKRRLVVTDEIDHHDSDVESQIQDIKSEETEIPERCVNCAVLHEPEGTPYADVIFIHGLHGGLDKTWTQGTWRERDPKLKDLTPVRRQSTGDMYVPVKTPQQQEDGKLKRTITRIYTTIPVKIRRTCNSNLTNSEETDELHNHIEEEIFDSDQDQEDIENISRCWPKDWLPQDCPGVRILAINYTTDKLWRPLWEKMKPRTDLIERSKEMMDELVLQGVGQRPIVWVGHSKGGLYIKQIMLNSSCANEGNELERNIYKQTKAIMFYSVPHKGSPVADMTFPLFRRSIEVLEVQTNCEFVLNLHRRFLEMLDNEQSAKPEIFSFIDTENVPVGFTSLKFISYESADPDVGVKCDVPLNHREICKPAGRDCFLYLELVKLINRSIFGKDTEQIFESK